MLALVGCDNTGRKKGAVKIDAKTIFGMTVLYAEISLHPKKRRINAQAYKETAARLKGCGAYTLCFHESFPEESYFLGREFETVDMKKLISAKSVDIISEAVMPDACFAVLAERADEESVRALEKACRKYRRVIAHLGIFTDMVCRELERRLGVSVKQVSGSDEWKKADGAIIFHNNPVPAKFRQEVPVLFAGGNRCESVFGGKMVSGTEFFVNKDPGYIPNGFSVAEIIAEAFNEGYLREAEIGVKNTVLV